MGLLIISFVQVVPLGAKSLGYGYHRDGLRPGAPYDPHWKVEHAAAEPGDHEAGKENIGQALFLGIL